MAEQISSGSSVIDGSVIKAVGGSAFTAFLASAGSVLAFATAFATFVLIFYSIREKIKNSRLIDAGRLKLELENRKQEAETIEIELRNQYLKESIDNNSVIKKRINANEKGNPDFSILGKYSGVFTVTEADSSDSPAAL